MNMTPFNTPHHFGRRRHRVAAALVHGIETAAGLGCRLMRLLLRHIKGVRRAHARHVVVVALLLFLLLLSRRRRGPSGVVVAFRVALHHALVRVPAAVVAGSSRCCRRCSVAVVAP